MSVLETALLWLKRGVRPVPVEAGSKRPLVPWRALQEHEPPEALVRSWFEGEGCNLGLLCGEPSGGLVVLDFDRPLWYHKWLRWMGERYERFRPGYTVRTARGWHVYVFVWEVPPRTLSMEGGDVKASGYVVAPPSIHPSGVPYQEVVSAPPLEFYNLAEVGIEAANMEPVSPRGEVALHPTELSGEGLIEGIKASLPVQVYLGQVTRGLRASSPDGVWMMCCCPLHEDRNPSMWVNTRMGLCRCFKPGCAGHRRAMDVINLHGELHGLDNEQAIMDLAARLGL